MTWSNQAIFNEQGEVVEILSVGNDTTQRRQAEEALQRSEAKFRIFENTGWHLPKPHLGWINSQCQPTPCQPVGFTRGDHWLEHSIDYL